MQTDRKQICHLVTEIVHELSEMVESLMVLKISVLCLSKDNVNIRENPLSWFRCWKCLCRMCTTRTDVWETHRFNKTVIYIHTVFVAHRLANSSLFPVSRSTVRNTERVESFCFLQTSLQSFISSFECFHLAAAVHIITTGISELFNHLDKWLSRTDGPQRFNYVNLFII